MPNMVPWLQRLSNVRDEELDPGLDLNQSFDDSGARELRKRSDQSQNTIDGMDSRAIDSFRQGVEITRQNYRFLSAAPKLWSGNINHWIEPNLVGQETDFTHFDKTNGFVDRDSSKTDPVAHLTEVPNTIQLFNNGLQQQLRATIDPFYIYGKKNSIEDPKSPIAGIKSNGGPQVEQKIRLNSPNNNQLENTRPRFDDQGAGDLLSIGLFTFKTNHVNTWVDKTIPLDVPYHDEIETTSESNPLLNQLTNPSADLISALITNSNLDLDEMLEGDFEYRSATAGYQFADKNTSRYGTDSIAFGGLVRGW